MKKNPMVKLLPDHQLKITFGFPIVKTLKLNLTDSLDRSNGTYKWYYGHVTGMIKKTDGTVINSIGIVEYINNITK